MSCGRVVYTRALSGDWNKQEVSYLDLYSKKLKTTSFERKMGFKK